MLEAGIAFGECSGLRFLVGQEGLPRGWSLAVEHVELDVVEGEYGAVLLPRQFLRPLGGAGVEAGVFLVVGRELGESGGGMVVGGGEEGGLEVGRGLQHHRLLGGQALQIRREVLFELHLILTFRQGY